ncbi:hypothetical protein CERZMDRAFT_84920 [Cercospora zeae-maydis SCOH1-5]|uniref:DUF7730 domain-containing protein n=1 Tax=Cercospora zeae-maydis SCOH1-5 TaxID=717836 RepID=A0A6A6FET7_9PEZI|nr:hypothetical protein CERZMDRAFT_84920 [Cercospora zeae-maydis SCOH1-5]
MAMKSRTLLDVRQCPTVLEAIHTKNASDSNFLSLPAEVRNQIYALVFGGDTKKIRVLSKRGHSPGLDVRRCTCESSEQQMIQHSKTTGDLKIFPDLFHSENEEHTDYHICCRVRQDDCLNLGSLRVCRQVYAEAALIPYSINEFIVDTIRDTFSVFTSALVPAQQRVIKRIALVGDSLPSVQMRHCKNLLAVKSLSLRVKPWAASVCALDMTRALACLPVDSVNILATWAGTRPSRYEALEAELENYLKRPLVEVRPEIRAAEQEQMREEKLKLEIAAERAKLESECKLKFKGKTFHFTEQQMAEHMSRLAAEHSGPSRKSRRCHL